MPESAAQAIHDVTARLRRRLDEMKFQLEQLERFAELLDDGIDPSQITKFVHGADARNSLARVWMRDGSVVELNAKQAAKLRLLTQFKRGISLTPIGAE